MTELSEVDLSDHLAHIPGALIGGVSARGYLIDDQIVCGYHRPGQPPCGSTDHLVQLFIGIRCQSCAVPMAQVYATIPATTDVPDVAGHTGLALAQPADAGVPGDPGRRDVRPPSRLPAPDRPMASVQLDGHGAAEQAAALVWGKTGKPRRRLLDRFIALGADGMTSWEAWRWYCDTHGPIDLYTLRPRLTELKKDKWIEDSGRRRHPRGHGNTDAPAEEVLVLTWRGRREAGLAAS